MDLNIANSIFQGYNDKNSIMICGYEWGDSKEDQKKELEGLLPKINNNAMCTFSNKFLKYGDIAKTWRYDNRIKMWFEKWGHPLNENNPTDFDKSIIQTNWCNTGGNKIQENIYTKLRDQEQVQNFLNHVEELNPKIIFFFGSTMINVLQDKNIKEYFISLMGDEMKPLEVMQKTYSGRKFKISFQSFKNCKIISLPHPSSSRGLSDKYIALYTDEIGKIISDYKKDRDFIV